MPKVQPRLSGHRHFATALYGLHSVNPVNCDMNGGERMNGERGRANGKGIGCYGMFDDEIIV